MVANILCGLVAFLQSYFLVVEMFLWQTPKIRKAFGFTEQFAAESASLAKNQGLYNGFLAAGIIWGVLEPDLHFAIKVKCFFLICVIVAGIYGAITANLRILYVQAVPALVALVATYFS
jgi:putative membrane protein